MSGKYVETKLSCLIRVFVFWLNISSSLPSRFLFPTFYQLLHAYILCTLCNQSVVRMARAKMRLGLVLSMIAATCQVRGDDCPAATAAEREAWESLKLVRVDEAGAFDKDFRLVGPGNESAVSERMNEQSTFSVDLNINACCLLRLLNCRTSRRGLCKGHDCRGNEQHCNGERMQPRDPLHSRGP